MPAEAVQEQGRRGVQTVKRWLEATTFIELQWNVYENTGYCSLQLLDGSIKRWDLAGSFLTGDRQMVYVENKDYSSAGDQARQFQKFLVNATAENAARSGSRRHVSQSVFPQGSPGWKTSPAPRS